MQNKQGTTSESLDVLKKAAEAAFTGKSLEEPKAPPTEKPEASNELAQPGQPEAKQAQPVVESTIPEKYRNKPPEELVKILQDNESYIGKLGSERAFEKKQADEFRKELEALKEQVSVSKKQDQGKSFQEELESDPAKAVIDYVDGKFSELTREQKEQQKKLAVDEARSFYQKSLENPDFARREVHINHIADLLQPYVKPEHVGTKAFIEWCDVFSQGLDRKYYEDQAKQSVAAQRASDIEEKRKAQVGSGVSSSSAPEPKRGAMTMEELKEAAYKAFQKQEN